MNIKSLKHHKESKVWSYCNWDILQKSWLLRTCAAETILNFINLWQYVQLKRQCGSNWLQQHSAVATMIVAVWLGPYFANSGV